MSLKAHQSWSHGWFLLISNIVSIFDLIIHVVIMTRSWNWRILMWCSFCQQPLLQLWSHSHFLSHTLMGSIYLCYVDFLLVTFGNGVMTNDWWCRDETESLMWARTHGWAARHALVSRLIVVIHYETIPMRYLLWTLSQNDRCILSQHAAIFYPNLS
jgi:hypothetical protein